MPCCDDEEHSPSEFHCHGETNDPNATFQGENNAEQNNSSENVASIVFTTLLMASFCMERLLFVKKFTLYFRRLNFFLWSIVIVLLLQQVHYQKPPVYTAESCSNESVFCFFSTKSEQTAIQQSHIINPLLTSFARSVRENIAFGFYRTDLAPSSLGLYENLRQYFPVQTSHSVNKSLIYRISCDVVSIQATLTNPQIKRIC